MKRATLAFAVALCIGPELARAQAGPAAGQPVADREPATLDPIPVQIRALPEILADLKVIHRRSQLIVGKANIVRTAVADGSIVDVVQYSPNEVAVIGLSLGSTNVTLWFDDNSEPVIYLVKVIRDPSLEERARIDYGKLEKKLAVLFPNSKVYLIPLSYKIVVKGRARDSEEAARILQIIRGEVINQNGTLAGPQPLGLQAGGYSGGDVAPISQNGAFGTGNPLDLASNFIVNMLEVPGEFQVMLRVRIAELKRSELKRLGVNFNFVINDGNQFFSSVLTGTTGNISGVFSAGDVNLLINALATHGHATLLAEPTLTVLSGHPASFISGGEFAVPTIIGVAGAAGTSTTFRGYGTSLVVTPVVLDKDLIRMQIAPEFSQLNTATAVNGIFGTNVRRVTTTVELREGQTIALAGLFSRQTEVDVGRVPFLGEIPLIGPLVFAAKQGTHDESELLILVTPELVRPMEPDEVPPVPGYEVVHPSDVELLLRGQTTGAPDQRVHQLAPYGHGAGHGVEVGYTQFNPAPADPAYGPQPTAPFGQPLQGPGGGLSNPFNGPMSNRYPARPGAVRTNQGPPPAGRMNPTPAAGPTPAPAAAGRYAPAASGPALTGGTYDAVNSMPAVQTGYAGPDMPAAGNRSGDRGGRYR